MDDPTPAPRFEAIRSLGPGGSIELTLYEHGRALFSSYCPQPGQNYKMALSEGYDLWVQNQVIGLREGSVTHYVPITNSPTIQWPRPTRQPMSSA